MKGILQYDINGNLIRGWKGGTKAISYELGFDEPTIKNACDGMHGNNKAFKYIGEWQ